MVSDAKNAYIPIECDLHDYLEIAALKRYAIKVALRDGNESVLHINDLETQSDKSEWLIGIDLCTSEMIQIRLDHIRYIAALDKNPDFTFVNFLQKK